jgi:hypothetical protein
LVAERFVARLVLDVFVLPVFAAVFVAAVFVAPLRLVAMSDSVAE